MSKAALQLSKVSMRFGGLHALRDVDLEIPQGERRAIIGPNGAGKSTLFNVIAGDLTPTSGDVFLQGLNVTRTPRHRRVALGLRRTYQTSALFDSLSVRENLYLAVLGPQTTGHRNIVRPANDAAILEQAVAAAAAVRLDSMLLSRAGDLSHGERRQLEIGLAIANSPQTIILDEPGAGLSADERRLVTDLLVHLDPEITVMLIEHDMEMALTVGERVTVLHQGEIIAEDSAERISSLPVVQRVYLGGGS